MDFLLVAHERRCRKQLWDCQIRAETIERKLGETVAMKVSIGEKLPGPVLEETNINRYRYAAADATLSDVHNVSYEEFRWHNFSPSCGSASSKFVQRFVAA
jgi:hypothetical protein